MNSFTAAISCKRKEREKDVVLRHIVKATGVILVIHLVDTFISSLVVLLSYSRWKKRRGYPMFPVTLRRYSNKETSVAQVDKAFQKETALAKIHGVSDTFTFTHIHGSVQLVNYGIFKLVIAKHKIAQQ